MEYCEYLEECKNKNSPKCNKCEYNKNNFEAIERDEFKKPIPKNYYKYANYYDPE